MARMTKAFVGAVAAGAMALVPATAASAQSRWNDDRGISVGDVVAGAVVLGGIAAVAGSLGRGGYDDRYDDRYYRDGRHGYYNGNPRAAVERCVDAARTDARSRGYRFAEVTQVRDVDDTRGGWRVRGNLRVEGGRDDYRRDYRDGRYYDGRYDRYDRGDRYRRDAGGFTCWVDRGRVSRMDYNGIRGM